MLTIRLSELENTRRCPAPSLDVGDPLAYRHYLYGQSGRDYIGNERLAWEFLRRSRRYRADIAAFVSRWEAVQSDEGAHPDRAAFNDEYDALCAKWHLASVPGLVHPDSTQPPRFWDRDCPRTLPPDALHIDGRTVDLTRGHYQDYCPTISVRFFLDAYLGDQVERFRQWVTSPDFEEWLARERGVSLNPLQPERRRQDDLYPSYLRVLDAERAGLGPDDICSLVHAPGAKKSIVRIDKVIERANELADSGYMGLTRLEPFPGKRRKTVEPKQRSSHSA